MSLKLFDVLLIFFFLSTVLAQQLSIPVGSGTDASPSRSCKDIYNVYMGTSRVFSQGIYKLFYENGGTVVKYDAYCTKEGHTLVLKMSFNDNTQFKYSSPIWQGDSLTLNPLPLDDTTQTEAKYISYSQVSANEVIVGFQILTLAPRPTRNFITLPINTTSVPSLSFILGSDVFVPFVVTRTTWAKLLPEDYAFQLGCNREGFNVGATLGGGVNLDVKAKIGFLANENSPTDCNSCNSGFLIGSSYGSVLPSNFSYPANVSFHGQIKAGNLNCEYTAVGTSLCSTVVCMVMYILLLEVY